MFKGVNKKNKLLIHKWKNGDIFRCDARPYDEIIIIKIYENIVEYIRDITKPNEYKMEKIYNLLDQDYYIERDGNVIQYEN
jgi:hypothetical protein